IAPSRALFLKAICPPLIIRRGLIFLLDSRTWARPFTTFQGQPAGVPHLISARPSSGSFADRLFSTKRGRLGRRLTGSDLSFPGQQILMFWSKFRLTWLPTFGSRWSPTASQQDRFISMIPNGQITQAVSTVSVPVRAVSTRLPLSVAGKLYYSVRLVFPRGGRIGAG